MNDRENEKKIAGVAGFIMETFFGAMICKSNMNCIVKAALVMMIYDMTQDAVATIKRRIDDQDETPQAEES